VYRLPRLSLLSGKHPPPLEIQGGREAPLSRASQVFSRMLPALLASEGAGVYPFIEADGPFPPFSPCGRSNCLISFPAKPGCRFQTIPPALQLAYGVILRPGTSFRFTLFPCQVSLHFLQPRFQTMPPRETPFLRPLAHQPSAVRFFLLWPQVVFPRFSWKRTVPPLSTSVFLAASSVHSKDPPVFAFRQLHIPFPLFC